MEEKTHERPATNEDMPEATDHSNSHDEDIAEPRPVVEKRPRSEVDVSRDKVTLTRRIRDAARIMTYIAYDAASTRLHRDSARVGKVMIETLIDEAVCSPPSRAAMTLRGCCVEYLAPCGISSLFWFLVRRLQRTNRTTSGPRVFARALWTVLHRILRQAMICRLFFRIGSIEYNLATAVGLVCCFFREDIFFEIYKLRRWPAHFSASQGLYAMLRTLAYTMAFALPLHKWSSFLERSHRRGNVKKLIFAVSLANTARIRKLVHALGTGTGLSFEI